MKDNLKMISGKLILNSSLKRNFFQNTFFVSVNRFVSQTVIKNDASEEKTTHFGFQQVKESEKTEKGIFPLFRILHIFIE